jgi:hypothetical protein
MLERIDPIQYLPDRVPKVVAAVYGRDRLMVAGRVACDRTNISGFRPHMAGATLG